MCVSESLIHIACWLSHLISCFSSFSCEWGRIVTHNHKDRQKRSQAHSLALMPASGLCDTNTQSLLQSVFALLSPSKRVLRCLCSVFAFPRSRVLPRAPLSSLPDVRSRSGGSFRSLSLAPVTTAAFLPFLHVRIHSTPCHMLSLGNGRTVVVVLVLHESET